MEATKGYTWCQRLLALALAVIMTVGYIPVSGSAAGNAVVSTRTDPPTLSRPEEIYGNNTMNAGKITVGKSVSNESLTSIHSGLTLTDEDNFLITVSQTAQVAGLTSQSSVPVDVVFVLDTSGSMDDNGRSETMVTAANSAITTLMKAHPENRVAVVAFSSKGYGGGSNGQNQKATTVLSDLNHYSDAENSNHLIWVDNDGKASNNSWFNTYIKGNNGYRHGENGGTNIQAGIAEGAKILTSVTDTTWTNPDTGAVVNRIPFLVLLSDGQPTFSFKDTNWFNPESTSSEQGNGKNPYEGNGFLTALTAAYYKGKITEKYYGSNASKDNRCYIYTIGVEIDDLTDDDLNLARITLDPANYTTGDYTSSSTANNYWLYGNSANDNYNKSNTNGWKTYWDKYMATSPQDFTIRVNGSGNSTSYTITANSINTSRQYVNGYGYNGGIAYNDGYYNASNVSGLQEIFNSLLSTISEKALSAPTKVTGTPELSGYVTFTDPIGEFMDVKDIKGIYDNGTLFDGSVAADYLNSGNAAFDAKLAEILKVRLEMTNTQNVNKIVSELITGRRSNTAIRDNSLTWWGKKIAASEESHVQCLGYANVTSDNMTDFIKSATAPTIDGITADTLCRSYIFYGTDNNNDYMYFMVRIQQDLAAPYKQTVVVSAPASLLSVDEVMITEEADGTATAKIVNNDEPLRVVYEVGLRSDINHDNVKDIVTKEMPGYAAEGSNLGENDTYLFYSNDWDRHDSDEGHHHRALAKATFDAAIDNPFYAYQKDTPILVKNGNTYTQYNESAAPSGDGYYYARTYYDWNGSAANADGTYNAVKRTAYIPIGIASGETDIDRNSSGWYVKKGTYTAHSLIANKEDVMKDSAANPIGALIVSHAHKTESSSDSHYTVLLGNNGVLSFSHNKTKQVYRDTEIDLDGKAVMVGDKLTYKITVINSEDTKATARVIDYIPEGTAYVDNSASPYAQLQTDANGKQYLEWTISDMEEDAITHVSFQVEVTEDALHGASPSISNQATVYLGDNPAYVTHKTKNPIEGKSSTVTDNNGTPITGTNNEEPQLKVGDRITYTIRYANDSDTTATVNITDVIPAGTTFVSATENGEYDSTKRTVKWTISDVAPGLGGTVSLVVYVDASAITGNNSSQISNNAGIAIGNNDPRYTNSVIHTRDVGSISVKKVVTGTDRDQETFTMILSDAEKKLSGSYNVSYYSGSTSSTSSTGTVTFQNGVGRLELKAGQTAVVAGLPLGTTISVIEDTANLPYWKDSYPKGTTVVVTKTTGSTDNADIQVTNAFVTVPVEFQLSAMKNFVGTFPDSTHTFSFSSERCDENGNVLTGDNGQKVTATVTKGSSNSEIFKFSTRHFTAPTGENPLYFRITENPSLDSQVLIDKTVHLLKLVIEYETISSGTNQTAVTTNRLIAKTYHKLPGDAAWTEFDWKNPSATPFRFTNAHPKGSVTITGTKHLTGRHINGSEFAFQLLDSNNNVISTATLPSTTTGNNANFQFHLTYDAADSGKTYTYRVKEVAGSDSKMTYDTTEYTVNVTVGSTADSEGNLTVSYKAFLGEEEKEIKFTNTYNNGYDFTLPAEKRFLNFSNDSTPSTFYFEMKDNATQNTVSTATLTTAGSTSEGNDVDLAFTPIHYSRKDMDGATKEGDILTKEFTYTVREIIAGDLTADPDIIYDNDFFTVKVEVTYNEITGAMNATVKSITETTEEKADDSRSEILFINFKNNAEIPCRLSAMKTTSGHLLPDGLSFSFEVLGATVDDNKNITIGKVEATGQSAPTQGGSSQSVTTIMVDTTETDEHGNLLTDENGNVLKVPKEVPNNETYSETTEVTFTELVYTQDDAKQNKTFYYIMRESNAGSSDSNSSGESSNGVTYDPIKYLVELTVTYTDQGKLTVIGPKYYRQTSGDGTNRSHFANDSSDATFTNTYNALARLNLTATKEFNRKMHGNEFDFELVRLDQNNQEIAGSRVTGTNSASTDAVNTDGYYQSSVSFATLNFSTEMLNQYTADTDGNYYISYHMREIAPATAGIPGVTYDSTSAPGGTPHTIVVKLTHTPGAQSPLTAVLHKVNKKDAPDGENTGITFRNTYTAKAGDDVTIQGEKELKGRALEAGEFDFVLYRQDQTADGTVTEKKVATATNNANGTFSFTRHYNIDTLNLGQNQDYTVTYRLAEEGVMPAGVTKDPTNYWIQVKIHHDASQAAYVADDPVYFSDAECTQELTAGQIPTFVNHYKAEAVYTAPTAKKTLSSKDSTALSLTEGQFVFNVYKMENGVQGALAATGSNKADGTVTFSNVAFTNAGEYVFKIVEAQGSDPSIKYDDTVYYWYVKVIDDTESGQLKVEESLYSKGTTKPTAQNSESVVFNNYQSNGKASFDLELEKVFKLYDGANKFLENKELVGSEFDFVVKNSANVQVTTGTNGASAGDDKIAPIYFEPITITLKDFNDHKTTGTNTATFVYTVSELPLGPGSAMGTTIDTTPIQVTVTVEQDPETLDLSINDEDIVYTKNNDNSQLFVNSHRYTATGTLTIPGTKVLRGQDLNAGEFNFSIYDENGKKLTDENGSPLTVSNDASGHFQFTLPAFNQPGEYTYTVREDNNGQSSVTIQNGTYTLDTQVYTVKVIVTEDKDGKLHAVPMYYMSSKPVSGEQTPEGEQTAEGEQTTNPEGNQTSGNTLTAVGGITFTNLYTPKPISLDLSTVVSIRKVITDTMGNAMNISPEGFQFQLSGILDDAGDPITAEADNQGVVTFEALTFTRAGTYIFYIHESQKQTGRTDANMYVMDTSAWMVEVPVTYDSKDGKLIIDEDDVKIVPVARTSAEETSTTGEETIPQITFTNVYNPVGCQIEIDVTKTLTGRSMHAGEFTFHLHDGTRLVAEAVNSSDGKVVFQIPYTGVDLNLPDENAVDGERRKFLYTIHEVMGNAGGVIYDPDGVIDDSDTTISSYAKKGIQVEVILTQVDGALDADWEITGEKKIFENSYVPEPVTPELQAMKFMEGRSLKDRSFNFILEGEEGSYNGYNLADGSIVFEKLPEFKEAGTYTYTLREDIPAAKIDGMTYDDTVLDIVFTVTDNLKGTLSVTTAYSNGLAFYNFYDGKPVEDVFIRAKKVLETDSNRTMKSGEFSFQLLDDQGNVIDTKHNDANGDIYFNPLWFDAAGTYNYSIREVAGTEKGMVYDDTVHGVTVTVKADENGDFTAQVSYDGKTTPPTFTNKFTVQPISVTLDAQKKLNGRALKDQEFKFTVYDSNGDKLFTGSNNTAGQISFQPLTFNKAGVYKYTIKENIGLSAYVQYDRKSYDVTVTVTETDGVLSAVVTYPEDGITFRNYYDPSGGILPQTGEQLPLLAMLCMAVLTPIALIFGCFFYFRKKRRA